ncbi:uncharacterized protein LOC131674076 [Phymastichus coffea]|uniref:uncharacterized protein LOC131674076 n=1 Tax=Phymastichus coffea TaxID=108790 RepID=UPI00273B5895|nr:uncharacterized protein LOC131674076 [Phymastichus coffea]XP_058808549.1 uncharacterized protein LOC131674076 [Phymastichus coffea]XP_058808550.1 uncharacterized protein LOC131674076 [Phymastichus coffea]XP_058808551.1 uncharacterized protein LOC131674076 [Phymastichus coffea]
MSTIGKESVVKSLPNVSSIKILPAQIARLKKEEEDEPWISGEELYTEGSSDEESCYKSTLSDKTSGESTLSIPKIHRPRSKVDKKKKISSPLNIHNHNTLSVQFEGSSSKGRNSPISSVSDEDEESRADDEISWKANRENLLLLNEIVTLEKHQQEYPKICDTVDQLFKNYFEKFNNFERINSEHFVRQNKILQEEVKSSLTLVDTVINEIQEKIEKIQKKTKHIQIQNRLRLKKIIAEGPPESQKLALNSKKFFELCTK